MYVAPTIVINNMLQIKIAPSDRYSLAEMAQMAVEAGAQWIVIVPGDESHFRDTGLEIATLCREAGIILTLEGSTNMTRELGLHGLFVPAGQSAPAAREALGPEAIIGTEVASAESALALEKADIDYVCLPADTNGEQAAEIIGRARQAGCTMPFVAEVQNALEADYAALAAAGYAGFVAEDGIFDASDPVADIENLLARIAAL